MQERVDLSNPLHYPGRIQNLKPCYEIPLVAKRSRDPMLESDTWSQSEGEPLEQAGSHRQNRGSQMATR